MQLSDHSLRQIDEAYLERLGDEALRSLSSKLLLDLKEARERLNQIQQEPKGSRHFALLASVIDTCRRRGHSPWEYLQTAITRRRQGLALLPLPV